MLFFSSVGASASVQGRLETVGLDQNRRPRKRRAINTKPGTVGKFRDHPYINYVSILVDFFNPTWMGGGLISLVLIICYHHL